MPEPPQSEEPPQAYKGREIASFNPYTKPQAHPMPKVVYGDPVITPSPQPIPQPPPRDELPPQHNPFKEKKLAHQLEGVHLEKDHALNTNSAYGRLYGEGYVNLYNAILRLATAVNSLVSQQELINEKLDTIVRFVEE